MPEHCGNILATLWQKPNRQRSIFIWQKRQGKTLPFLLVVITVVCSFIKIDFAKTKLSLLEVHLNQAI